MLRGTAFDCALRVLTLRDHSEWELRRKLKVKGYDNAGIEESLERLKGLGYLDDARFARSFAAGAIRNGRGFGARLKLELSRRGVAAHLVQEILAEVGEEFDEAEELARTISRRYPGFDPALATEKEKRKMVAYLQRKGFTLSAVLAGVGIHSR